METAATVQPPKRRRWVVRTGVILLLALGLTWPYTRLMLVLSREASAHYPGGIINPSGPFQPDNSELLEQYSPKRLAGMLWFPRATVRALICEALTARHPQWDNEGDWSGIMPKLCRVAVDDPDPAVRTLALTAVQQSPDLTEADVQSILKQIAGLPGGQDRQKLLALIVQKQPKGSNEVAKYIESLRNSSNVADQLDALAVLARHQPKHTGVRELLVGLTKGDSVESVQLTEFAGLVGQSQPEVIREMLTGSDRERLIALGAVRRAPDSVGPELSQLAEETAIGSLKSDSAELRVAGLGFMATRPQGGHLLLAAATESEGTRRLDAIQSLARFVQYRPPRPSGPAAADATSFQFTAQETDSLLELLSDPQRDVRVAVGAILSEGMRPNRRSPSVFLAATGPLDPAQHERFASLLHDPEDALVRLALEYFSKTAAPQEPIVPAITEAIVRVIKSPEAEEAFRQVAKRFPKHADFLDLTQRMALEENTEASGTLVRTAARQLLDTSPAPQEVFDKLLVRYENSAILRGDLTDLFVSHIPPLEIRDPKMKALFWQEYLSRYYTPPLLDPPMAAGPGASSNEPRRPPRPKPARPVTEIAPLLDADLVRDGLHQFLKTLIHRRDPYSLTEQDYETLSQDLGGLEEFPNAARDEIVQALKSNDAQDRSGAIRLLVAGKLADDRCIGELIALLDDGNALVRVLAADTLAAISTGEPNAKLIEGLRKMGSPGNPEAVRASGLRNLVHLAPQDPETQALADRFQNDSQKTIQSVGRWANGQIMQHQR